MKRIMAVLIFSMVIASFFLPALHSASAETTGSFSAWVEPSDSNMIPARIDLFRSVNDGGSAKHVYQLFLPGNANAEECFLSWEGAAQMEVDGENFESGACPVPSPGTEMKYILKGENSDSVEFNIKTFQGSSKVIPVFIDIDESHGSIEAMNSDSIHETACEGRICISGTWHEMPKIKGRGNFTWRMAKDKHPYNITLGSKTTIPGIDCPATKKWSVLAEIADHSLLRNRTGFYMAHELGIGNDSASADIWMNGEYLGMYTITPKTDSYVSKNGFMIEEDNYLETLSVEEGGDPQFSLEGLKAKEGSYNLITVKKIGDNLLGQAGESPENIVAVANSTIKPWLQDAWDAARSED